MIGSVSYLDGVYPMQELYPPDGGPITYPPSVLMIGNSSSTLQLKQRLENNGCQVCRMDFNSGNLDIARRQYFDVIVFNLEQPDDGRLETYQEFKTDPELAHTPVIVLMPDRSVADAISGLKSGKVYCLPCLDTGSDVCVEVQVLQIIEYIHYMTCRYT